jgi:hypothetical protein
MPYREKADLVAAVTRELATLTHAEPDAKPKLTAS